MDSDNCKKNIDIDNAEIYDMRTHQKGIYFSK